MWIKRWMRSVLIVSSDLELDGHWDVETDFHTRELKNFNTLCFGVCLITWSR
jgi:hypothetical protein